jgi:hypothetical protein
MPPMDSPSQIAMNMPNASLMYSSFTPTFGNLMFQIAPSQTGEVNFSFGTVPYLSLEALLYQQQISAQVDPAVISAGQHSGQHNVQGSYTVTDQAGNVRVQIGSGNF